MREDLEVERGFGSEGKHVFLVFLSLQIICIAFALRSNTNKLRKRSDLTSKQNNKQKGKKINLAKTLYK